LAQLANIAFGTAERRCCLFGGEQIKVDVLRQLTACVCLRRPLEETFDLSTGQGHDGRVGKPVSVALALYEPKPSFEEVEDGGI